MPMLAIAVDGAGHTHVIAGASGGMVHLTNEGGGWASEQLTVAPEEGLDSQPALVIADDGRLLVAFTRWLRYDPCVFGCEDEENAIVLDGVYLLTRGAGGWQGPRPLLARMQSPSLAIRGGTVHLAAAGASPADGSQIVYAAGEPEELAFSLVTDAGWDPRLSLAPDGQPVIAHWRGGRPDGLAQLVIARLVDQQAGAFALDEVPGGVGFDLLPAELAIDARGDHHLAWTDNDTIVYAAQRAGRWSEPEPVLHGAELAGMAVDDGGTAHLLSLPIYYDGQGVARGVWYATNRDNGFDARQIAPGADAETEGARFPSAIALDRAGRPHVVFTWLGDESGLYLAVGP